MKRLVIMEFPNGLTVRELKRIVKDWPDEREDGEPTEVWIGTGWALSSPVNEVWPLTLRNGIADILFESDAYREG